MTKHKLWRDTQTFVFTTASYCMQIYINTVVKFNPDNPDWQLFFLEM